MKKIFNIFLTILFFATSCVAESNICNIIVRQSEKKSLLPISFYDASEQVIYTTRVAACDTLRLKKNGAVSFPIILTFRSDSCAFSGYIFVGENDNELTVNVLNGDVVHAEFLPRGCWSEEYQSILQTNILYNERAMEVFYAFRRLNDAEKEKAEGAAQIKMQAFRDSSNLVPYWANLAKPKPSFIQLYYLQTLIEMRSFSKDFLQDYLKKLDKKTLETFSLWKQCEQRLQMKTLVEQSRWDTIKLGVQNQTTDCQKITLAKNKIYFVFLSTTFCGGCRRERKEIAKAIKENKILAENVIEISTDEIYEDKDEIVTWKSYLEKSNFASPYSIETEFWSNFTPYGVIVNKGIIVKKACHLEDYMKYIAQK